MFRLSFTDHPFQKNGDIRMIRELLGHWDIRAAI